MIVILVIQQICCKIIVVLDFIFIEIHVMILKYLNLRHI